MNENKKVRVAITHGDTNGIGYELIFKTFAEPEMLELCTPIVYGSPKIAAYHRNALGIEANFTIIKDAKDAQEGRLNLLPVFDDEIKVELGVASEESGAAGLRAVDRALDDYRQGLFDVLVTAPVDNNEQFHFSGQSRYIEDHLETEGQGLSVLVNEELRVALATRNLPLRQVAESISKESIINNATTLFRSLRRDFRLSSPRIAVLGLNPKAGDNGLLGSEEQEFISPAIDELADKGIQLSVPIRRTRSSAAAMPGSSTVYWQCITNRDCPPSVLSPHAGASIIRQDCPLSVLLQKYPTVFRWQARELLMSSPSATPFTLLSTFSATVPNMTSPWEIRCRSFTRKNGTKVTRCALPSHASVKTAHRTGPHTAIRKRHIKMGGQGDKWAMPAFLSLSRKENTDTEPSCLASLSAIVYGKEVSEHLLPLRLGCSCRHGDTARLCRCMAQSPACRILVSCGGCPVGVPLYLQYGSLADDYSQPEPRPDGAEASFVPLAL